MLQEDEGLKMSILELLASGYIAPEEPAYSFYPTQDWSDRTEADLLSDLADRTERIFTALADKLRGRRILVPLSGGLDSRLVLAWLVKLGADVSAWSYGPPGNGEAKIAKQVASRLGVPWQFVPSRRRAARKLFNSPARKAYWNLFDDVVPNMQEFQPLIELNPPKDMVIINGQAGDWIVGGHIPRGLDSFDTFFDKIIEKHYSLWLPLVPEVREIMRPKIKRIIKKLCPEPVKWEYAWDAYECATRQTLYVKAQQINYDWMGYEWELPLWDELYLDFWPNVPVQYRYGEYLYKRYLKEWNYRGVFDISTKVWRWPGAWKIVVPLAHLGPKETIYSYMKYFGHYSNQYAAFPFSHFAKRARLIRNPVSLYVEQFVKERYDEGSIPSILDA